MSDDALGFEMRAVELQCRRNGHCKLAMEDWRLPGSGSLGCLSNVVYQSSLGYLYAK
jgi:hypothetical protein